MKSLLKGLAPVVLFLLTCSGEAVADPVWNLTVTNNTGMTATGFQLIFTGTGGSITNPVIVMNAAGAGAPTITVVSSGSGINVSWGPPGIPPGGSFTVQFSTQFSPIQPNSGFWLVPQQIPVDFTRDNVTLREIPEPFTLLLLATGLAGVAINSRKKLKGSGG